MDAPRMDRSLGELFSDLSQQTADLIRQEMRLAKAELSEKLADAGRHAMMIGVAIAFGLAAVVTVAAAITLLLVEVGVEPWLAAVITAAVMGLVAYVLAQSGISALRKKIDRSRRNDSFPQGDDPVAQERNAMNASHSRDRRDPARDRADPRRDERNDWRDPGAAASRSPAAAGEGRRREAATGKVKNIMSSAGETAYDAAQRARGYGNHLAWYAREHPDPHRDHGSA